MLDSVSLSSASPRSVPLRTVSLRSASLNLRRLLVTSILAAASLTVVVPVTAPSVTPAASATSGNWLDTSDRAAVLASYQAEFGTSIGDPAWTGDRATCDPGTTPQVYRDAVVSRVNWFRAMAGVPAGITENQALSAMAQESALMMSESGQLSHDPDGSFSCYTVVGDEASGKSNLYLGRTGPDAITGYVRDPGTNNSSAGHRNWILHPTSTQIGTGDIPSAGGWASNTLYVIQDSGIVFGQQPTLREEAGFVAWPPAGYVPGEMVFERWSLGLRNADFSSASVSLSVGGQSIPVFVEYRSGGGSGAPFPIMVWNSPSLDTTPAHDTLVTVTVSNVALAGGTTSFTYETIIIGEELPTTYNAFINQAYQDFLGRNPTTNELNQWSARLHSGTSRLEFVSTLVASEEWTTVVVDNLYRDTLGRQSDPGGALYWTGKLRNGSSVANVASQFYGSAEYVQREGGTWSAWLTDLYVELLDRTPDNSGLQFWVSQAGQRGSGDVAFDFYQSTESRQSRVRALYQHLLGRDPDPGGLVYWTGVLNSGDDLALAAFLAGSDEYFSKAG